MAKMKAGPVVSDNGMFIIDAPFPPGMMAAPAEVGYSSISSVIIPTDVLKQLLQRIKMLTGVVEVGLFCDMAQAAYFGNEVGAILVVTM